MAYVLHFVPRAPLLPPSKDETAQLRAEEIADHFKRRAGYRHDATTAEGSSSGEAVAHYVNEDTGVAFLFRIARMRGERDAARFVTQPVGLEVALLRPHIFGLEAEREAHALVTRFAFDVVTVEQPQQQQPYSSDAMLRDYAIANTAAHAAVADLGLGKDRFVLPSGVLTSAWRWNVQRAKLQRAFVGDSAFVPKVICVAPPPQMQQRGEATGVGVAATAVVWTRFMPAFLPLVDIYILVTNEGPPLWIERTKAGPILEALPIVSQHFRYQADDDAEEAGIPHYDARQAAALAPQILAAATLGDLPRVIPMTQVLSKEIALRTTDAVLNDTKAEWLRLKAELSRCFDAGDVRGALVVARTAADAFSGSTEPSVRAYARMALMTLAEEGVRSGDLDDAERAAKELVVLAKRDGESGEHHATHASYQLGLIALAREAPFDGIHPFRVAAEGFAKELGPVAAQTVIARVNHGLALLQAERFTDAVRVLSALVDQTRDAPADVRKHVVPALHNLGLALLRAGFPDKAIPHLDEALAAREREVGTSDPLYVDTLLVKANVLVDLGKLDDAAVLIRQGGSAAFMGGGEGHHLFAEAVFTEARRVSKVGDGLRADALARRALRLTELECGVDSFTYRDRSNRASRLRSTWRASTRLADPGGARQLCVVTVRYTLRRWSPQTLSFSAAEGEDGKEEKTLSKTWYVDAPAPWVEAVRHVRDAVRLLFASSNDQLNAREPSDANYLDMVDDVAVRAVGVDELSRIEWESAWRDVVWEPSGAYVATVAGLRPITFSELGVIVTARQLLAKLITPEDAQHKLVLRFKLDEASAADVAAAPIDAEASVIRPE